MSQISKKIAFFSPSTASEFCLDNVIKFWHFNLSRPCFPHRRLWDIMVSRSKFSGKLYYVLLGPEKLYFSDNDYSFSFLDVSTKGHVWIVFATIRVSNIKASTFKLLLWQCRVNHRAFSLATFQITDNQVCCGLHLLLSRAIPDIKIIPAPRNQYA